MGAVAGRSGQLAVQAPSETPGVNEPARVIEPTASPARAVDLSMAGLFLPDLLGMLSARPLFNPMRALRGNSARDIEQR
jgi:hypothetical protein